ncbi:hypothetical protein [Stomatohabitans albus]|uniref:hypothetical protein n=1 Tax=Stomatohabitans albus TaxID=3110766 RepID=UPI00300D677C
MDPLNLRGGQVSAEIVTGITLANGWTVRVRLVDGREIGPVTLCQPPPLRTGTAGGTAHTHAVMVDPPRAGARVLVFVLAQETIGVLM